MSIIVKFGLVFAEETIRVNGKQEVAGITTLNLELALTYTGWRSKNNQHHYYAFKILPAHEAVKFKEKLNKELNKAREFLNEKFSNMLKAKGIKISKEEFLKLKPFHWGFEFYEVFDLEKPKEERGFDVIIGNPPYVASAGRSEISMKIEDINKEIFKRIYEVAKGQFDLYTIFIERSITTLQRRRGKFGYIIPDAILVITKNKQFYKKGKLIFRQTSDKIKGSIDDIGVVTIKSV